MNGFAAEGFANGLVSGLEAVNKLVDSEHRRKALDEENAYRQRYYDAQAHKEDIEAQKLESERVQKERAAMAPQLLSIGQRVMDGEDVTPEDIDLLHKGGVSVGSVADDNYVNNIKETIDLVRNGKVRPDDPVVTQAMYPVFNRTVQRNIGGVSIDPDGNIPVRTVKKEFAGLVPNPKDPTSFGVKVKVTGVDADGNTRSYESLASQHGTSASDDPYAFFNVRQLEGPFAATLAMNEGLRRNPNNRARFMEYVQNTAIDPETQSKIDLHNAQAATEGSKQTANKSLASSRDASAGLSQARTVTETNRREVLDARKASLDRSNRPQTKQGKVERFNTQEAERLALQAYPDDIPAKYGSKPEASETVKKKRSEHIAKMKDLKSVGEIDDPIEADRIARQGRPIEDKTPDGRRYRGIQIIDKSTGQPRNIPTQWLGK